MLPSACDVRVWLKDNQNGLKRRIEDSKGECLREDGNDT